MSCTRPDGDIEAGGVRLRTKKVAHIKGISPYAQAFWLCKLGYGWVALHLFFGKAYDRPTDYVGMGLRTVDRRAVQRSRR